MRIPVLLILTAGFGMACAAWGQERKPRIAVGGLVAESNSLYPRASPMRESNRVSREVWLETAVKASTVPSGIVEAAGRLGLDIYPVLQASASFLGYVEKSSFDEKLNEMVRQIKTARPPYDGVILVQHGAMVVDGYPQGDAEVVRRVRQAMGRPFPIVVTHDFHSNVCQEIVDDSDVLIYV